MITKVKEEPYSSCCKKVRNLPHCPDPIMNKHMQKKKGYRLYIVKISKNQLQIPENSSYLMCPKQSLSTEAKR